MSAFIVSERTMHFAVLAMTREHGKQVTLDATQRSELGRKLFALNQEAVRQRYGEVDPIPDYVFAWPADYALGLASGRVHQMLKSLHCLIYQCSEGNVPEELLYQQMQEKSHVLADEIIGNLPEYDRAQWD